MSLIRGADMKRRFCDDTGSAGGGDAVYGLGLIGAGVYYWQIADGVWPHVVAILKALVWPVFAIYELLGHLAG